MTEKLGMDMAGQLPDNFNGTVTTYGYDNANRLTSLENKKSDTTTLASYNFTLDGNGNRTQILQNEPLLFVPGSDTVSYSYNAKKNRLLTAGGFSFGYDNEGQLSTGYSLNYTFDYEHRLKTIGSTIQFYYDGAGNRVQAARSGVTTRYIYDAKGNLLAEADGNNNITKYYVYGNGLLAMVTPGNQTYCYHFNAVGSTIAMTDSTQSVVNKYSYDPFGNITNYVEVVAQLFKFVGQHGVMTEPNGFYYMRARYYDSGVGRFISEDPLGFDGGDVNLMVYVQNNPVLLIDPEGLEDRIIGTRGGQPMVYNTDTRQYTLSTSNNYVDPLTGLSRDFVNDVLIPAMPFTMGLATTLLTDNPRLGGLAYELTDTATGLLFDQPAGIPYVPVSPLINPPCAY
jgi:RHS repeat-associated protein